MATITEDYVSFEIAKLLKEKGFDEPCQAYWRDFENGDRVNTTFAPNENHNEAKGFTSMPTHQMAMKWLREEKNIFIDICTLSPLVYIYRVCLISDTTGYFYEDYACEEGERFMSYKEAVEFALDYCLNNILEV